MPVAYVQQCLQKIIDNVKHNESSKLLSRYVLVECAQGLICQDVNHVVPCEGSLQSMKVSRGPRHDWQNQQKWDELLPDKTTQKKNQAQVEVNTRYRHGSSSRGNIHVATR